MFNGYFYWHSIRNYVAVVGNIFSTIEIERPNNETIKVPISYGPKEKALARVELREHNVAGGGDAFKDNIAITLPRMSFELKSMKYDASRKLNKQHRITKPNNISDINSNTAFNEFTNNFARSTFTPVPYDFNFELSVMSKFETDATLIMDQIIPKFTPQINIGVKMEPSITVPYSDTIQDYVNSFRNSLDIFIDTPVILNSLQMRDSYAGDFNVRRILLWTIDLSVKGVLFGETKRDPIIKKPQYAEIIGLLPSNNKVMIHKFTPYTGTKDWREISIGDSDEVKWLEEFGFQ